MQVNIILLVCDACSCHGNKIPKEPIGSGSYAVFITNNNLFTCEVNYIYTLIMQKCNF